jgi:hypothetical protein
MGGMFLLGSGSMFLGGGGGAESKRNMLTGQFIDSHRALVLTELHS